MDLVTGGNGFIGTHLVTQLRLRGRPVRVLDVRPPPPGADPTVEYLQGSVTDADVMRRAVHNVERVFHLAAVAELWARDRSVFDRVNRAGTECVLDAAAANSEVRRFVYTSSEVVLLAADPRRIPDRLSETVSYPPAALIGAYARSKRAGECAVLAATDRGLPSTVVIPTVPIGPGDTSLTPPTRMLTDLLRGRMPAYPDVWMDVVDARDVALGHILAADRGVPGTRYLLAGHSLRMGALVDRVCGAAGVRPPRGKIPHQAASAFAHIDTLVADVTGRAPRAPRDGARIAARMRPCDNARARIDLGFEPRPLDDSIRDAVSWLRAEAGPF